LDGADIPVKTGAGGEVEKTGGKKWFLEPLRLGKTRSVK